MDLRDQSKKNVSLESVRAIDYYSHDVDQHLGAGIVSPGPPKVTVWPWARVKWLTYVCVPAEKRLSIPVGDRFLTSPHLRLWMNHNSLKKLEVDREQELHHDHSKINELESSVIIAGKFQKRQKHYYVLMSVLGSKIETFPEETQLCTQLKESQIP
ncbi:hypothetical protein TNCV_128041 [Trichonephila clavipes]|nr:hypothetical protein TNCV_128041 [Trichonephila clavipes]